MARLRVRLFWTRSPSPDVTSRRITVTKGAETSTFDIGPEVSEYLIEVESQTSVTFKTEVKDDAGNTTSSDLYTFTTPDTDAPLPDTSLGHEILGVIESPEPSSTTKKNK